MIIRILGEGQFDVPDEAVTTLNELDATVEASIEAGDEAAFRKALDGLLAGVREAAAPHEERGPAHRVNACRHVGASACQTSTRGSRIPSSTALTSTTKRFRRWQSAERCGCRRFTIISTILIRRPSTNSSLKL